MAEQKWLECRSCQEAVVPVVDDVREQGVLQGRQVKLYHNEPTLDIDHDPDVSHLSHVLESDGFRITILLHEGMNLKAAGMVESPTTIDHWLAVWRAVPGEPSADQMLGLMRGEGR